MDNVTFLKDRKHGGYIMNYEPDIIGRYGRIVRDLQEKAKEEQGIVEDPKSKVSKTVTEMVEDLRYQNGLLQANVETAKEMREVLIDYLKKTNMSEYVDTLEPMTDEQINEMTLKDIDNTFPGCQLMPFDAPEIKEIEAENYGYNEMECHNFLIVLRDKVKSYRRIIETIDEAKKYTDSMAHTLRYARIKQAERVMNDETKSDLDRKKAREYIRDLDIVLDGSAFFRYAIKNIDRLKTCGIDGLKRSFAKWAVKHDDYMELPDLLFKYNHNTGNRDAAIREDFLTIAWMSYVKYAPETMQRDLVIKKSTLSRLHAFFSGALGELEGSVLTKNIDTMYNVINGSEDNPWI